MKPIERKAITFIDTPYNYHYEVSEYGKVRTARKKLLYKKTISAPYTWIYKRKDGRVEHRELKRKYNIPVYKEKYRHHNGSCYKYNKDGKAYTSYMLQGKRYSAHRLVARAFMGLDINNLNTLVCHKDDNPENNHYTNLFIGSQKDNIQDMVKKFRSLQKLTKEDIYDIYALHDKGYSTREIGDMYSVSGVAIWKHLQQRHLH